MAQRSALVGANVAFVAAATLILTTAPAYAAIPTADSGPDLVAEAGSDVVLTGSAGDADGDPLEIRWLRSEVVGGDLASCTFSGPTAFEPISPAGLAPTFNCTEPGQYLLQLVAADGTSFFDDTGALVTFTESVNSAPVVDSGPSRFATAGSDATLAGSASDPDGDPLEIRWLRSVVSDGDLASCTFTGPTGFEPISPAGLAPTINCTEPGEYLLQLIAGDGTTSVDDIGALVTFTEPIDDLTGPTCTLDSVTRTAITVVIADPETGVATIRTHASDRLSIDPRRADYEPPSAAATVTVTRDSARAGGVALILSANADGDDGACLAVVPRHGRPFLVDLT